MEFNGDGEARVECDEDGRRPGQGAGIGGDEEVNTATTSRFQERLRQSRRALEFLLVGCLQRSETAGVPGDWTEE